MNDTVGKEIVSELRRIEKVLSEISERLEDISNNMPE